MGQEEPSEEKKVSPYPINLISSSIKKWFLVGAEVHAFNLSTQEEV